MFQAAVMIKYLPFTLNLLFQASWLRQVGSVDSFSLVIQ